MKICILGLGYIGLPTGLLLAEKNEVIGFDPNKERVEMIRSGKMPFKENGLQELYNKNKRNFIATNDLNDIKKSNAFLIAVPTPITKEKKCDLKYVKEAAKSVGNVLKIGDIVILESTVPPKTTTEFLKPILERESHLSCGKDFYLSFISEKAIPGDGINEMINNDRIIGAYNQKSADIAKKMYSCFVKGDILITDCNTAEIVKLMENTYRDVNIALANEFLKIAEDFKINVWEAIKLANRHPRVNIHSPGPGVGGHCIPIVPWFIANEKTKLIPVSRNINDMMTEYVCKLVDHTINECKINKPTIALLGVAYKKNVDDARETPTKKIYDILRKKYNVILHDPHVNNFEYPIEKDIKKVLGSSNVIVILTDHDFYKGVDFGDKIVIDTKNCIKKSTKLMGDYR